MSIIDPGTALSNAGASTGGTFYPSSAPWGLPDDGSSINGGVTSTSTSNNVTNTANSLSSLSNNGFTTTNVGGTSSTSSGSTTSSSSGNGTGGVTNAAGVTNQPGILEFLINGGLFVLGLFLVLGGFLKS